MNTSVATVIKTGNSIALRVPKTYAERNNLRIGAKISLPELKKTGGSLANLQDTIDKIRQSNGIPSWDAIKDPARWQHEQRSEWL